MSRLAPIYKAYDSQNYKKCIRLIETYLSNDKIAEQGKAKALCAMCYAQLKDHLKTVAVIDELVSGNCVLDDDWTLNSIKTALRAVDDPETHVRVWEVIYDRLDKREDVALRLFQAYSYAGERTKQQQLVLSLQRETKKPLYTLWIVICMMMRVEEPGDKLLVVARMMLKKYHADPGFTSVAEVNFALLVYEYAGVPEEGLALLDEERVKALFKKERQTQIPLRIRLLKVAGHDSEVVEMLRERVHTATEDDYDTAVQLVNLTENRPHELIDTFAKIRERSPKLRGPWLALMEVYRRSNDMDSLAREIELYIEAYGSTPACANDLGSLFGGLEREAQLELISRVEAKSSIWIGDREQCLQTATLVTLKGSVRPLTRDEISSSLLVALIGTVKAKAEAEDGERLYSDFLAVSVLREMLASGASEMEREEIFEGPGEKRSNSGQIGLLNCLLFTLLFLKWSPKTVQLHWIAVKACFALGFYDLATMHVDALDLKSVQHDSVLPMIGALPALKCGSAQVAEGMLMRTLAFRRETNLNCADYIKESLVHGNFVQVGEFEVFRTRALHSLHARIAHVLIALWRLRSVDSKGAAKFYAGLAELTDALVGTSDTWELIDNTDYFAATEYLPASVAQELLAWIKKPRELSAEQMRPLPAFAYSLRLEMRDVSTIRAAHPNDVSALRAIDAVFMAAAAAGKALSRGKITNDDRTYIEAICKRLFGYVEDFRCESNEDDMPSSCRAFFTRMEDIVGLKDCRLFYAGVQLLHSSFSRNDERFSESDLERLHSFGSLIKDTYRDASAASVTVSAPLCLILVRLIAGVIQLLLRGAKCSENETAVKAVHGALRVLATDFISAMKGVKVQLGERSLHMTELVTQWQTPDLGSEIPEELAAEIAETHESLSLRLKDVPRFIAKEVGQVSDRLARALAKVR